MDKKLIEKGIKERKSGLLMKSKVVTELEDKVAART